MTEFRWTVTFVSFTRTTGVVVWINLGHIVSVVYTKSTDSSKIVTIDGVASTVKGDAVEQINKIQKELDPS